MNEEEKAKAQAELTAAKISVLKRLVWAGWIDQLNADDVMDVKIVPTKNGEEIIRSISHFFTAGSLMTQLELVAFVRVVQALKFT